MQFLQGLLLASSSILYVFFAYYAFRHREVPGAISLGYLMLATVIWSVGAYFEIFASSIEQMIFWRNVQQIGVFGVPMLTLSFAIKYTLNRALSKIHRFLFVFPAVINLLIFTNGYHHLMRSGYDIVENAIFGKELVVHATAFDTMLVGINFVIPLLAVALFFDFRQKIGVAYKRQVTLLMISTLYTFLVTALKMSVLSSIGIYISMSVLYIPSAILFFFSLFRFDYFNLAPIAYNKVFDVIHEGVVVINKRMRIVDINPFATALIASEDKIAVGKDINACLKASFQFELAALSGQMTTYNLSCGDNRMIDMTYHPIIASENIVGAVLLLADVTGQKEYEKFLIERAYQDGLTGLLNRFGLNYFHDKHEGYQSLIVCVLDLDHFKSINDQYGHLNGDTVLIQFSDMLRETFTDHCEVARIGGEEFALYLYDQTLENAFERADTFRKRIDNHVVFTEDGNAIHFTVSIGISISVNANEPLKLIIARADEALYAAKNANRNRVMLYETNIANH
ncbi:diguanylate cyclase [Fusibacter paucivorans]|uniref:Diguanylate cyclase n=1 Tax=Fusibacter paucivorans TaxID=76009 RepID=A0ABS5PM66_9FIRM|nr:diguanylate cyclase [Fusibacter paucivorans]MBS7526270.1 diguanylate cyclase [Fusibacter paucivorans]